MGKNGSHVSPSRDEALSEVGRHAYGLRLFIEASVSPAEQSTDPRINGPVAECLRASVRILAKLDDVLDVCEFPEVVDRRRMDLEMICAKLDFHRQ